MNIQNTIHKVTRVGVILATFAIFACGDRGTGPEKTDKEKENKPATVLLFDIEKSIYDYDVYVNLDAGTQKAIAISDTTSDLYVLSSQVAKADIPAYDLAFGGYSTQLNPETVYSVKGTLLGEGVTVVRLDSTKWTDVTAYGEYTFTDKIATIGHDWKSFNRDAGVFTLEKDRIYVVKTKAGKVFKLQFLNFYLADETGYPQFQYQEIEK